MISKSDNTGLSILSSFIHKVESHCSLTKYKNNKYCIFFMFVTKLASRRGIVVTLESWLSG